MAMKVMLVNPPIRMDQEPNSFPLGLGYVASALRQAGHHVEVLDINAYRYTDVEVEEIVKTMDYDLLGTGGLSTQFHYLKWLCSVLKHYHPEQKIVVGNYVATPIPRMFLEKTQTDIVCTGEGELTAVMVANAIEKGEDLSSVKGIAYKQEDGEIRITPPVPVIPNMDDIPFPAWDLFPTEIYVSHPAFSAGKRQLNMVTSRGCPYLCIYCQDAFGKKVRVRSPDNVIGEMKELKKRYGVEYIVFNDELFVVNVKRVYELCDKMIEANLGIKWSCNGRVNIVDEPLLKKMHDAGCNLVAYGIESGSQKILNIMKKAATREQALKSVLLTRRLGMYANCSFIIGSPGETRETVFETVDFCQKADLRVKFFYMTAFPGTELYEQAKTMGKLTPENEDWHMEQLGEMSETMLINFSEMGDEELRNVKKEAEDTLNNDWFLKAKKAYEYARTLGPEETIRRVKKRMLSTLPTSQQEW